MEDFVDELSIDAIFSDDHEKLAETFRNITQSLQAGAAPNLDALERELEWHMRFEEEVLFPALRAVFPSYSRRAFDSLTIDHLRIRSVLSQLRTNVQAGQAQEALGATESLRIFLEGHNRDEERGLYPDADRLLPAAERRRLIEAFRERRAASIRPP